MGDAVRNRLFQHGQRNRQRFSAVVETRQNVAMNVDHNSSMRHHRHAVKTCQNPKSNISPANTWRMRRGCNRRANCPPKMPPRKTPGIKRGPVCHETYPALAYSRNARMPVGGISATRLVPCARCWLNPNISPRSGTNNTPPPIPTIPAATPQSAATNVIPAIRPALLDSLSTLLLADLEDDRVLFHNNSAERIRKIPKRKRRSRDGRGTATRPPP